jgi:hypothetical protein
MGEEMRAALARRAAARAVLLLSTPGASKLCGRFATERDEAFDACAGSFWIEPENRGGSWAEDAL